jgi:hypothetical protein
MTTSHIPQPPILVITTLQMQKENLASSGRALHAPQENPLDLKSVDAHNAKEQHSI